MSATYPLPGFTCAVKSLRGRQAPRAAAGASGRGKSGIGSPRLVLTLSSSSRFLPRPFLRFDSFYELPNSLPKFPLSL